MGRLFFSVRSFKKEIIYSLTGGGMVLINGSDDDSCTILHNFNFNRSREGIVRRFWTTFYGRAGKLCKDERGASPTGDILKYFGDESLPQSEVLPLI